MFITNKLDEEVSNLLRNFEAVEAETLRKIKKNSRFSSIINSLRVNIQPEYGPVETLYENFEFLDLSHIPRNPNLLMIIGMLSSN